MRAVRIVRCKVWVALVVASALRGLGAPSTQIPDEPQRPDVSAMTPEQASAALADFKRTHDRWLKDNLSKFMEASEAARAAALQRAKEPRRVAVDTAKVSPVADYDWQADAEAHQLDAAAREHLARDGMVIAGPTARQSFSIYADDSVTPFITTDSLLNGFHVLLEATLRRFEMARAMRLRQTLDACWQGRGAQLAAANVSAGDVAPYLRRIALVLGPAMRLLGSHASSGEPSLDREIDRSVELIRRAQDVALPAWLAPATQDLAALDFRRCKPIGFYDSTPMLADYYRAVRWLQMVPFRASRPDESAAAALLVDLDRINEEQSIRGFVDSGSAIWGKAEGLDIVHLAEARPGFVATLGEFHDKAKAVAAAVAALVRCDQSRLPASLRRAGRDATMTVLAPAVLPDTQFEEELAHAKPQALAMPRALEVGAWLGSDLALTEVQRMEGSAVARALTALRDPAEEPPYWSSTVPEFYYHALRSLFADPDPAAPPLMRSDAWRRKSLQTALAGWAQLRHAWELQSKLMIVTTGMSLEPAGFVEPNTEFYVRLHELASVIVERMQAGGAFDQRAVEAEYLRRELALVASLGLDKVDADFDGALESHGEERVLELAFAAQDFDPTLPRIYPTHLRGAAQHEFWARVRRIVQHRIEQLERGEPVSPASLEVLARDAEGRLFQRWQLLETMTARFAAMSEKQLRGVDWSKDEAQVIKRYHEDLGEVMGYMASAADMPKDDAPRWTVIGQDRARDELAAVAIGRPRNLWLLYPWHDRLILCRGALMPFFEYLSHGRLTDAEWRDLLDSSHAPPQPQWIQPIISAAGK